MKNYYRIMLGRKSAFAEEAYKGNFIGTGFIHDIDLTNRLPENWRDFNKEFIPLFLEQNPEKTKVSAGLACAMLWTIAKKLDTGDIVLCPNGKGAYYVGEITGPYEFHKDQTLPHRRSVRWISVTISRDEMSEALRNSTGAIGTLSNISKYANEIESFISGNPELAIISNSSVVEDVAVFGLEKHLEEFLVHNWDNTDLGKNYDIYEEDGEKIGQQYPSDTGPIDILAISKDKKEFLVVELKRGRISDVVVGQIQRYMGFVKEELCEEDQKVKGVIIGFEDDIKIKRALSVAQNIDMYTYKVSFKLEKK